MKKLCTQFILSTSIILFPAIVNAQTCPANITQNIDPGTCGAVVTYNVQTGTSGVHLLNFAQPFFDYADNVSKIQVTPFNNTQIPLIFTPTDGNKMSVFLQNCASSFYMYQDVTLPVNQSNQLGFDLQYQKILSGAFSSTLYYAVEIRNPVTNVLLQTLLITTPTSPNSTAMIHYDFNLSAYAGQTVRLEFNASFIDYPSYIICNVYLDNITLPGSTLTNGSFENNYTGWTLSSGVGQCGTWGIGTGPSTGLTQTGGLPSGSTFPVGITTNTFKASDANNPYTCSFTVTVLDNVAPTMTCNDPITVPADQSACGATVYYNVSANDNCSDAVVTQTSGLASGSVFPIGVTTNSFVATDASGNTATCSFTVTVTDTQNPIITCPGNMNLANTPGHCGATVNYTVTASDNCTAGLSVTQTAGIASGNEFPVGTTTNAFIAADAAGNTATCSFTVTVTDNEKPTLIGVPANTTAQCGSVPAAASVTATDNCPGVSSVTYNEVRTDRNCPGNYTLLRTWSATDAYNNIQTATQVITVSDNTKPIFTTFPESFSTPRCDNIAYDVQATDNCNGTVAFNYTFSGATTGSGTGTGSNSSFNGGATTVTITATDACGNAMTKSFTITKTNTDPPVPSFLGDLAKYYMVFTDGSEEANWQGASKGFNGDIAVNGILANEKTSGSVPYAGKIYTNANTLGPWQNIVSANVSQAGSYLNETSRLAGLTNNLENAFLQINALTVTPGFESRSAISLNNLNYQNGIRDIIVINVTDGFKISTPINIYGDSYDLFILRWDADANFSNGYNEQVKFQSGGAIVPKGGLTASNFVNVAGDIDASGGGKNPIAPYPQGPRNNNGTGSLINGGANFNGGGFFTGYWLTTGEPKIFPAGLQPYGKTSSFSNAIFVGAWYTKTTKFSMTSGTSGTYVGSACALQSRPGGTDDVTNPITDLSGDFNVTAMPNPTYSNFMLHITGNSIEPKQIRILDMAGKTLNVIQLNAGINYTTFGSNLITGIYFAEVIQGKNRKVVKLVKAK